MSKDTKELTSSSMKHVHRDVTCLFDLPDEILLLICRYLSPSNILYSFYTPLRSTDRLHRVIFDYYTNIKLDQITCNEYMYLSNLFRQSKTLLRPTSLILSNEHITCLIQRYFSYIPMNTIESMLNNLKRLTLINCSQFDGIYIYLYDLKFPQLEYLYLTFRKLNENKNYISTSDISINEFIFEKKMRFINTIHIKIDQGLVLNKSLIPHENLRNVYFVLKTIDDLYILLDGLIANVQTMVIQLCQSRILDIFSIIDCSCPKSKSSCPGLTMFTLLEPRTKFCIDDLKCILNSMPNLIKLTLSIRDTLDPIFCHGPSFESILIEYLSQLRYFEYTMAHRIVDPVLIEDFARWPMTHVFYENCKWIHIYSLPWPSSKDDKRELPIVTSGCNTSVRSDVKKAEYMDPVMITTHEELSQLRTCFHRARQITTCLSIDTELPFRIHKIILTEQTSIDSKNIMVQASIRHLIVKYRLSDEREISILTHQYPNIKYLKLLLPLDQSVYIRCLKSVFSRDESLEKKNCFWSQLIYFTIEPNLKHLFCDDMIFHDWLIENTDLKYYKYPFHVKYSRFNIAIWL